jgi:hypothetical protein
VPSDVEIDGFTLDNSSYCDDIHGIGIGKKPATVLYVYKFGVGVSSTD